MICSIHRKKGVDELMHPTEMKRISEQTMPDAMPNLYWECLIDLGDHADLVQAKIMAVVGLIASKDSKNWPTESEWVAMMPDWLIQHIPTLSVEEMTEVLDQTPREDWDHLPWEFGSWIDALKDRGWVWWGCDRKGKIMQIVLEIVSVPPRIDAIKQIPIAAGAEVMSEIWEPKP